MILNIDKWQYLGILSECDKILRENLVDENYTAGYHKTMRGVIYGEEFDFVSKCGTLWAHLRQLLNNEETALFDGELNYVSRDDCMPFALFLRILNKTGKYSQRLDFDRNFEQVMFGPDNGLGEWTFYICKLEEPGMFANYIPDDFLEITFKSAKNNERALVRLNRFFV